MQTYTMHDVILVTKSHSFQQHQHVAFDLRFRERFLSLAYNLRKVGKHVVEHQDETVAVRKYISQLDHLKQTQQVGWSGITFARVFYRKQLKCIGMGTHILVVFYLLESFDFSEKY